VGDRFWPGVKSEQLNAQQKALFGEAVDADIAAIEAQLDELKASTTTSEDPKTRPKRTPLPPNATGTLDACRCL